MHSRKGEKMRQKRKQRLWMALALAAVIAVVPVSSSEAKVRDLGAGGGSKVVQIGGNGGIDPQYENAATITADLSISGSTAHVHASAAAKKVCTVSVVMRLQHKEDGSWVTKKSWVSSSNSGFKALSRDTTLTQRGEYRTYALFDVGGEELSYKSVTLVY